MARTFRILREAGASLSAHPLRTALMMLGVVVGSGALAAGLSVGQGTREHLIGLVAKHGLDMIMIRPGGTKQVFAAARDTQVSSLREEDGRAVEAGIPGIRRVALVQNERGWETAVRDKSVKVRIFGVSPVWQSIRRRDGLAAGAPLAEEDEVHANKVCVLGHTTAKTLFPGEDPIGQSVRIGNDPFRVKGVFKEIGPAASGNEDWDDRIVIPFATSSKRLFKRPHLEQVVIQVDDPARLPAIAERVRALMRERHGIAAGGDDDFFVREPADLKEAALSTSSTLTGLLVGLSATALLVGGLVIMNLLLLSVAQRAREIGLRRAVGARRGDILAQFLAEALGVCLAGGLVGLALGAAAAPLLSPHSRVDWLPAAAAIGAGILVALVFGLHPARRAAALEPAAALSGRRT